MRTVAIVGGGPAGAMAAEKLARGGATVIIFEERPGSEKPCGGGVSYKALRHYPFLLEATGKVKFVRDTEFVAPNGKAVRFRLREPLAIYARATLNRLLLGRAAEAGAGTVQDRITDLRRAGNGWELNGRSGTYQAGYVVLAAGARSRLRNILSEDFRARDFMLTFGYYVPGSDDLLRVQFFEDFEGYAWAFPRPDHLSVGICGKVGEIRMSGLRDRLYGFMRQFDYPTAPGYVFSHLLPALTTESWDKLRLSGTGWALIGDAAGLADPITGEGIYFAMRSGELLAQSILEDAPALYGDRLQREFGGSLALGARLAPLFYCGDFLGAGVTTRMIEFASLSRAFMELLQDLVEGGQAYSGLAARLYRNLPRSLIEILVGSLRELIPHLRLRPAWGEPGADALSNEWESSERAPENREP